MPHNPRRSDIRDAERERVAVALTDEQITDAMSRALRLRQQSAVNPADITIQPMRAYDAIETTRNYRFHSHWYQMKHWRDLDDRTEHRPDPWWWIGWVYETPGEEWWRKRTWVVWLNVEDGRVHLRFERPWEWQDDGCPY